MPKGAAKKVPTGISTVEIKKVSRVGNQHGSWIRFEFKVVDGPRRGDTLVEMIKQGR